MGQKQTIVEVTAALMSIAHAPMPVIHIQEAIRLVTGGLCVDYEDLISALHAMGPENAVATTISGEQMWARPDIATQADYAAQNREPFSPSKLPGSERRVGAHEFITFDWSTLRVGDVVDGIGTIATEAQVSALRVVIPGIVAESMAEVSRRPRVPSTTSP